MRRWSSQLHTLYCGKADEQLLREVPDNSISCVVTSPPYYKLRDYGIDGQIGLEDSPERYIAALVGVFKEVKRVLTVGGTCWVVMGDSYNRKGGSDRKVSDSAQCGGTRNTLDARGCRDSRGVRALASKNLLGIPWRFALALQSEGWILRQDIVWAKPNPMPESVTDRPTRSHEYIFLFTKSERYYYNQAMRLAARDPVDDMRRLAATVEGYKSERTEEKNGLRIRTDKQRGHGRRHQGFNERRDALTKHESMKLGANLRDVWWMAPANYKKAHFATFPINLPLLCIQLGCPVDGLVLDPFAGAGTTLAAAAELGRLSIGVELNPLYCDLIVERLSGHAA